jgi:hypothetical protein
MVVSGVVDVLHRCLGNSRVFTMGLGSGADRNLIEQVSHAGNGKYEYVTDTEKIIERVVALLESSAEKFYQIRNLQVGPKESFSLLINNSRFFGEGGTFNFFKKDLLRLNGIVKGGGNMNSDPVVNISFDLIDGDEPGKVQPYKYQIGLAAQAMGTDLLHKICAHKVIRKLETVGSYDLKANVLHMEPKFRMTGGYTGVDQQVVNLSQHFGVMSKSTA